MKNSENISKVRRQYEEYPYPERNPLDEIQRLNGVTIDCLDRINHYCHSGSKDFSLGSRILVAGGGTGDSAIFFAEQLRDTDSEVIYLDLSEASMSIARQRAEIRGLDNITWVNDSILNIPSLNLGSFDHISCTGVLHHLKDPSEGLRALKSVLNKDGAMSLMVYGKYGRTAIYHIQALMKLINQNVTDMQTTINNCRTTLDALPSNHWFKLAQHKLNVSDIELYDCYMHSQDQSFNIPRLYELINSADLQLVHLFDDYGKEGNALYDPSLYIKDEGLLASISNLAPRHHQAIAEVLNGRILLHSFYATETLSNIPDKKMLDLIPSLSLTTARETYSTLYRLVCSASGYIPINISSTEVSLGFRKTQNMEMFFKHLDGKRSMKEIYDIIIFTGSTQNGRLDYESLGQELNDMFAAMDKHNLLLLRHKSVPIYKTLEELQARIE